MATMPTTGAPPYFDPVMEEAVLRRIREKDAARELYEYERRLRVAEAERRRHDELVARRRRNGRLIRDAVVLAVLGGIVAFAVVVCTWVAHGVDATVASTPAVKRSLVTAATAGWQWGMIGMVIVPCLAIVLVFWGTRLGE